jgi:hypothetical protein
MNNKKKHTHTRAHTHTHTYQSGQRWSSPVGTSGRGEIATLVSRFSNHASKLYKSTKCQVWLKIIPSLRSERWSDFTKQEEWVRVRFIAGYLVFTARKSSVERKCLWCNKFKDGRMTLNNDPKKHISKPRTSHTYKTCVIVEGLIREALGRYSSLADLGHGV